MTSALLLRRQRSRREQRAEGEPVRAIAREPEASDSAASAQRHDIGTSAYADRICVCRLGAATQQAGDAAEDRRVHAVAQQRPQRHDERQEEQHDLEVDDPESAPPARWKSNASTVGKPSGYSRWAALVDGAERVRIERSEDEPAVPVDELRLERPVGVGVELDQRLGGRAQHERCDENRDERARQQAAPDAIGRLGGRPPPDAAPPANADAASASGRAGSGRPRGTGAAAGAPLPTRTRPGATGRSSRAVRDDPRCRPPSARLRRGRASTRLAARRPARLVTGASRASPAESPGAERVRDPDRRGRRVAEEQPRGPGRRGLEARGEDVLRPRLPGLPDEHVAGFGWSALPQRPPRTIENDALTGSRERGADEREVVPAVASGPRANEAACADRRRLARPRRGRRAGCHRQPDECEQRDDGYDNSQGRNASHASTVATGPDGPRIWLYAAGVAGSRPAR